MTDAEDSIASLALRLPRHAALLGSLRHVVELHDGLRWLELGCSLGAGEGDDDSDLDVAVGYAGALSTEQLHALGQSVVDAVGQTVGVLVHRMEGWPTELCRVAVEYADGVQLDLVLLPAEWREGRPDRTVVVVDKDGRLQVQWVPPSSQPPSPDLVREWMFLGWWALSAAAKYIKRGSLFEATEALSEVRKHALQLFAASRRIAYPAFGLVSLLDFPPIELPPNLATTYGDPSAVASVISAAHACADLLEQACRDAAAALGVERVDPIAAVAHGRLLEAVEVAGSAG
jgi:hypothetical protein